MSLNLSRHWKQARGAQRAAGPAVRGRVEQRQGLRLQGWVLGERPGEERFTLAGPAGEWPLPALRQERQDVASSLGLPADRLLGFSLDLPPAVHAAWTDPAQALELRVDGQPLASEAGALTQAVWTDELAALASPAAAHWPAAELLRRRLHAAWHLAEVPSSSATPPPWWASLSLEACQLAPWQPLGEAAASALSLLLSGRPPAASPGGWAAQAPLALVLARLAERNELPFWVLRPLAERRPTGLEEYPPEPATLAWPALAERLGLALPASAALDHPLSPAMQLLQHLLDDPALARWLALVHGVLVSQARDGVAQWLRGGGRRLAGAIELVDREHLHGWLCWPGRPDERLQAEVRCGDVVVGIAPCSGYRRDVQDRFGGSGRNGFRAAWEPARLPAGQTLSFTLHDPLSGLQVGPALRVDNSHTEQRRLSQLLSHELAAIQQRLDTLAGLLPHALAHTAYPLDQYAAYRASHRTPPPPETLARSALALTVLIDAGDDPVRVRRALDLLRPQTGLVALRLVGGSPAVQELARVLGHADPRIDHLPDWAAAAQALEGLPHGTAGEPWVLLLAAEDRLDPLAGDWLSAGAASAPDAVALYWDEDLLLREHREVLAARPDRHQRPILREPFDPEAMLELNVVGLSFAARREALRAALPALPAQDGPPGLHPSQRERLVWALAAQGPLQHLPQTLLSCELDAGRAEAGEDPRLQALLARATPEALRPLLPPAMARQAWQRVADPLARSPKALVHWVTPGEVPRPTLAVLIPTRDHVDLLRQCVDSLLATAAEPASLAIWVADNGSTEPATLDYLRAAQAAGQLQVLRVDEPFNWSRLNNQLVARCGAEQLLFLNNDTIMLSAGWDRTLRGLLAREDVGAVGARLLYEDLTVQHGGIVFGHEGFVGHEATGTPVDDPRALFDTQLTRRVSGVTGAFLACRREVFERVGPFDEHALCVAFNDVDWCARLASLGLHAVYAPALSLIHLESKSRGLDHADPQRQARAEYERDALQARWPGTFDHDPLRSPRRSGWSAGRRALR